MIHLTPSWSVPPWRHARYPWTAARVQTLSSSKLSLEQNAVARRSAGSDAAETGWIWGEDGNSVAAVVVDGEVKLVLNGMGPSESMPPSAGLCVRTAALGRISTIGVILKKLIKYE